MQVYLIGGGGGLKGGGLSMISFWYWHHFLTPRPNNIMQQKSKAATITGQDIPSLGLLTTIPVIWTWLVFVDPLAVVGTSDNALVVLVKTLSWSVEPAPEGDELYVSLGICENASALPFPCFSLDANSSCSCWQRCVIRPSRRGESPFFRAWLQDNWS